MAGSNGSIKQSMINANKSNVLNPIFPTSRVQNIVDNLVKTVVPAATNASSVKPAQITTKTEPVAYSFDTTDFTPVSANNNVFNDSLDIARSIIKENNAIAQQNAQMQYEYNSAEAEKARQFQLEMSNTAHQREVADLKAAGLNPVLSAGGSGAASYSAASASGNQANIDTSLNSVLGTILSSLISSQTQLQVAGINAQTAMHNADISAQASRDTAYMMSQASRYGSDMSYKQTEKLVENYLQQAGLKFGTDIFNNAVRILTTAMMFGL